MRAHVVAVVAAGALALAGLATCTTAPPPKAGASQGTFCGSDLECDDGLVCACGTCSTPGATDQPPACNVGVGCPKPFPTPCVDSCATENFIGNADCNAAVESCSQGVLETTCVAACPTDIPSGYRCTNGTVACESDAVIGPPSCITPDACQGQTPFLCVEVCGDTAPFGSTCLSVLAADDAGVNDAYACDDLIGFPQSDCVDGGPPSDAGPTDSGPFDGGPCEDQVRPLCLHNCDPSDTINAAQCRAEDGGPFDWSCSGFPGYVPADECVDAGPDAGPADAG